MKRISRIALGITALGAVAATAATLAMHLSAQAPGLLAGVTSDRNAKTGFEGINEGEILRAAVRLPALK